jgi:uncharacterized protein (TIGR02757 family)
VKSSRIRFDIREARSQAVLRQVLEEMHLTLVDTGAIYNDAQAPARRYDDPLDREFAAFVCAIIAYGKIAHIKVSIARILNQLGDRPVIRLLDMSDRDIAAMCDGWAHRFNNARDISRMLVILKTIYQEVGSLENLIRDSGAESAGEALEILIEMLIAHSAGEIPKGDSFWFFLSRPSAGSACKRLNLFLRWMVGRSSSDFGLWTSLKPSQLIIPVDTHVLNQSHLLGLTRRKTGDWQTAEEITASLRLLDPDDPTRFDFALCHIGIRGLDILELVGQPHILLGQNL